YARFRLGLIRVSKRQTRPGLYYTPNTSGKQVKHVSQKKHQPLVSLRIEGEVEHIATERCGEKRRTLETSRG
ncbi:hypothetical protein U1Q18_003972, partial [Sarracenia purpurea var. burkii]